jgi:uncharacterized protein (TIGR00369 family)
MSDSDPAATPHTRTRLVTWDDPRIGLQARGEMTGREYLEAIRDGRLPSPPIASLLGFRLAEVDDGRAVFTCTPGEEHYNPIGVVHGGLAATLLDSAMGCAVASGLPRGAGYTTLELKVNLIRALTTDTGPVRAEGAIIHLGRTTATAEARLTDAQGRLLAHATTTCLILRPTPADS